LEAARTGNWFMENNLVIARLDKLSRNEDVQAKLTVPDGQAMTVSFLPMIGFRSGRSFAPPALG